LTASFPADGKSRPGNLKKLCLGFEHGEAIPERVKRWRQVSMIERAEDRIPSTSSALGAMHRMTHAIEKKIEAFAAQQRVMRQEKGEECN
jgi:hypothetical protein